MYKMEIRGTYALLFAAFFMILGSTGFVLGQSKETATLVPPQIFDLVLINVSDSPIALENPRVLLSEGESFKKVFRIRNRTAKSIKRFQIRQLDWVGKNQFTSDYNADTDLEFLPYEEFDSINTSHIVIKDSNEDLRTKFRDKRAVWIAMVTQVELWDGTMFDASKEFALIEAYVQTLKISSSDSESIIQSKKTELLAAIDKILEETHY